MSKQFLDKSGVTYFWNKVKNYIPSKTNIKLAVNGIGSITETQLLALSIGDLVIDTSTKKDYIVFKCNVAVSGNSVTSGEIQLININYNESTARNTLDVYVFAYSTSAGQWASNHYEKVYYSTSETYTKDEVNGLLSNLPTVNYTVRQTLGSASAENYFNTTKTIFMVPGAHASSPDSYDEYICLSKVENGATTYYWELIGNTRIDMSEYVKKSDTGENLTITRGSSTSSKNIILKAYGGITLDSYGADIDINSGASLGITSGSQIDIAADDDITVSTTEDINLVSSEKVTIRANEGYPESETKLVLDYAMTFYDKDDGNDRELLKVTGSDVKYKGNTLITTALQNADIDDACQ